MNPGRKISFVYSSITIGLVLLAGGVFFILSSHYTEVLYFRYLNEKAQIVAMERFEKDELDSIRYQNVVWRRQHSIPTSKEIFINTADLGNANKQLSEYLDNQQLKSIYDGNVINFKHDDEVGSAILYYDNEGTFAVIVLSHNPYGDEIARTIGWALIILILLTSLILFLFSRLYAIRMVNRIDADYQAEKLFVNNASHEINNPLTAIRGECEVALMRDRSGDDYRKSLQRISKETERIVNIIQHLLLFSHEKERDTEKVTVSQFLQQFAGEQTHVIIESDFKVSMKEELLQIAIRNLIDNAHKYSNGQPVIVISTDPRKIEIIDQGIGIPKADLPRVFSPFYRAGNTEGIKGNGIGLALTKSILEKYGASIKVQSAENHGTTVSIKFPK